MVGPEPRQKKISGPCLGTMNPNRDLLGHVLGGEAHFYLDISQDSLDSKRGWILKLGPLPGTKDLPPLRRLLIDGYGTIRIVAVAVGADTPSLNL
jgi:hypothetical protein